MGGFREPRGAGWDYPAEDDDEEEESDGDGAEDENENDDNDDEGRARVDTISEDDRWVPRGRRWVSPREAGAAADTAARLYEARLRREPGER